MGRMIDNGENVHAVLEELGFDSVRVRDLILLTAGAGDKLEEAITAGSQAWDENIALTREAELRYGTMASRLQFAKNRLNDMAITIGNVLAPILVDFVDKLEPFIETIADFVRDNPQVVKWLAALAGALVGIGGGLLVIGGALKGASILLGALQGIGGLIGIIAGIGLGPLLLIIGALVGGALLIIKYWDEIKAFFSGFWEGFSVETDGIKDAFARVKDEIMRVVDALGLFKDEAKSAEDASEDAGNSVGRFFGQALAVVLDALAGLLRGIIDLALGLWAVLKFIGVPEALALIWDALLVIKNGIEALIDGVWWLVDAFSGVVAAIGDGFDIDLFAQGQAMLQSFLDGFLSIKDQLMDAISGVLSEARDFLPFSDAKKGPLSDLTASGAAFLNTFREGFAPAEQQLQDPYIVGDVKSLATCKCNAPALAGQVPTRPALAPDVSGAS